MHKLVIFTASFPFGEKETYLETEINYLCAAFEEVDIFPLYYNNRDKSQRVVPNNAVVHLPPVPISKMKRLILFAKSLLCKPWLMSDFVIEFFEFKIYKSFEKFKSWLLALVDYMVVGNCDEWMKIQSKSDSVFYFYWGVGWSYSLTYLRKNCTNKYFVRLHGGEAFLERSNGYIPLRNQVLSNADFIIASSSKLKDYVSCVYRVDSSKIIISRLGTLFKGTNPYDKNNVVIRLISVSNLIDLKRVYLIVEILKHIVDYKIEWIHFGDGPLLKPIKQQSALLPPNIISIFKGRVTNNKIFEFYESHSIDCFINVSKYEGLPVSVMEAMSFGIPIIATDAGATSEIVDDSNGLLLTIDFDSQWVAQQVVKIKEKKWLQKRTESFVKWQGKCSAENNYSKLAMVLVDGYVKK